MLIGGDVDVEALVEAEAEDVERTEMMWRRDCAWSTARRTAATRSGSAKRRANSMHWRRSAGVSSPLRRRSLIERANCSACSMFMRLCSVVLELRSGGGTYFGLTGAAAVAEMELAMEEPMIQCG